MKSVSAKEFARVLEHHGWTLARIQGSHHIYVMEGRRERISLPVHGSEALRKGLLHHFMRVAGIREEDL